MAVLLTVVIKRMGYIVKILPGYLQVLGQRQRIIGQGRFTAGAKANGQRGSGCLARRCRFFRCALQNDVGVGATKAKRVDANHQTACGFQWLGFGDHAQVPFVELDARIQLANANGRGHLAVLQAIKRFGKPRHARGGFQVADITFYRTNRQRRLPMFANGLANGAGFDGVANSGAGTVGF